MSDCVWDRCVLCGVGNDSEQEVSAELRGAIDAERDSLRKGRHGCTQVWRHHARFAKRSNRQCHCHEALSQRDEVSDELLMLSVIAGQGCVNTRADKNAFTRRDAQNVNARFTHKRMHSHKPSITGINTTHTAAKLQCV